MALISFWKNNLNFFLLVSFKRPFIKNENSFSDFIWKVILQAIYFHKQVVIEGAVIRFTIYNLKIF